MHKKFRWNAEMTFTGAISMIQKTAKTNVISA